MGMCDLTALLCPLYPSCSAWYVFPKPLFFSGSHALPDLPNISDPPDVRAYPF